AGRVGVAGLAFEDGLTGSAEGFAPVRLLMIPRSILMLAASLAVLGAGLALGGIRRTGGRGALAVLGLVALAAAAAWRPQAAAALIYAAEPGAVVLVVTWAVIAVWRYRTRAGAVFAPVDTDFAL